MNVLKCQGREINWKHIVKLYDRNMGAGTGISMVTKIKYEHVFLNSFSKMRVDLAAQVQTACTVVCAQCYNLYCRSLVIAWEMLSTSLGEVVHLRQHILSRKLTSFLTVLM